jgi:prevent-host-death family protein
VPKSRGATPPFSVCRSACDHVLLTDLCTAPYSLPAMRKTPQKGAEEARNQLPDLLAAAEKGRSTLITRHGRPVAALIPLNEYQPARRQQPLSSLKGSGRGLWGGDSTQTIRELRDEWTR